MEPPARFGLAVSGGADSLALLLLAHRAFPGRFAVASVDHGLRGEAADECRGVAAICAGLGVPHATLTLTLTGGAGVQERARAERYAALAGWAEAERLGALVTAHQADDQAETLVMRLNRGAGLRGLAGMRPRATTPGAMELPLLRPLLGWRRSELGALVSAAGWAVADDPSNRDARFERVRVRGGMAKADWLDAGGLAASAGHLVEADAALDWAAAREWSGVERLADGLAYHGEAPRAVRLRVLARVVAELGTAVPRGSELARWHDALAAGRVATLAGVRGDGAASRWRFTRAAPPRTRG